MAGPTPDGGVRRTIARSFDPEEFRRRNAGAVVMDLLYLLTTAFFTALALDGLWPAAIAAAPLATLLYFGAKSSPAFLIAQLLSMALTVAATYAGVVPL